MVEPRLAYNYARIDETGWCYEVLSTAKSHEGETGYIAISAYNVDYMDKYYNVADGKWYEDAAFTIEWIPA